MPYGQRAVYLMSPFLTDIRMTETDKIHRTTGLRAGPIRIQRKSRPVRTLNTAFLCWSSGTGPRARLRTWPFQMLPWLLRASMQN
jgi:hypothetical protein